MCDWGVMDVVDDGHAAALAVVGAEDSDVVAFAVGGVLARVVVDVV